VAVTLDIGTDFVNKTRNSPTEANLRFTTMKTSLEAEFALLTITSSLFAWAGTMYLEESSAGSILVNTDANNLVLESSGNTGLTLASGTSSTSRIVATDSGASLAGMLEFSHASDIWTIGIGGSTAVIISRANGIPSIRMGSGRLFYDDTNNVWRVKEGSDPSSATDGNILMESA
jgi:hypothetical protein